MTRFGIRTRILPLLLLAACGGGRSGTGISADITDLITEAPAIVEGSHPDEMPLATIAGKVTSLQLALAPARPERATARRLLAAAGRLLSGTSIAAADGGLGGIHVTLERWGRATETDADGFFQLSGDFAGPTTLLFEREDGVVGAIDVDVPRGGALVLHDIGIDTAAGRASSDARDLSFDGIVTDRRCLERRLVVASRFNSAGATYVVDLANGTLQDPSGKPLRCLDLREGDHVHVQGLVQPNGRIAESNTMVENSEALLDRQMVVPDVPAVPVVELPDAATAPPPENSIPAADALGPPSLTLP